MSIAKAYLNGLIKKIVPALLLVCVCLSLTAGCSGPLKVNYTALKRPGAAPELAAAGPASLFISELKDGRTAAELKNPMEIGRIDATVFDINGNRLIIADDPAELVTGALAKEFVAAGYDVSTDPAVADFVLTGELKEFRLDIADRDRIAIEVASTLIERETGNAVWAGSTAERSDRYAGVMGNSKASIEKYINASLAKVAGSIVENATATVTGLRSGRAPEKPVKAEQTKPQPVSASGTMSIMTKPARAKVYIGGAYYGLTPLTLELAPGIYELEIKQKGYRDGGEKVSVRQGEKTEVEMELAGE